MTSVIPPSEDARAAADTERSDLPGIGGKIVGYYIKCFDCGLSTRQYAAVKDAAEAWNRRPEDRLPEGLKNIINRGL